MATITSGNNARVHPVEMDLVPSSYSRGTVATVPLDQVDMAMSSEETFRRIDSKPEQVYSSLTFEEARWSSMRRRIPGMSTVPRSRTTMYVNLDPQAQALNELRLYVRQHFHMKECSLFVPAPKQKVKRIRDLKCHCGEILTKHARMQTTELTNMEEDARKTKDILEKLFFDIIIPKELRPFIGPQKLESAPSDRMPQVKWGPEKLRSYVTKAFGKISFINVERVGGQKPAKYIRMSTDDSVEDLIYLMKEHWKIMEPKEPHVVISVVGGAKNFKLDGRMRETFSTGLIKAAKTTSAWLISSGFNMGVMKAVGQSVNQGQSFIWDNNRMAHEIRCIGFAPWGYIKDRNKLVETEDGQGKFYAEFRTSNVILHGEPVPLNSDHTHFVFVDDGYRNRYGGVAAVRAKFEQRISQSVTDGGLGFPVVLVVVEGGTDALNDAKTSLDHRIPVVVCSGTGRAADILAYAYSHTKYGSGGVQEMKPKHVKKLQEKIFDAYGKSWKEDDPEEIDKKIKPIFDMVQSCCQNADLMTILNMNKHEDLDLAIISVLLKACSGGDQKQRLKQLQLALTWDRVDIAQEEIFREDVLWEAGSLDDILSDAILNDKVKFVELILQQGCVVMKDFLTRHRLQNLYLQLPKHHYICKLVYQMTGKEEMNLRTVKLFLNKILEGYKSFDYERVYDVENSLDLEDGNLRYKQPYQLLLVWAILSNRHGMALFSWEMGDEPITSALAATNILNGMIRLMGRQEAHNKEKLIEHKMEFEQLGTQALNECNKKDPDKAMMIVERRSPTWDGWTCLQLAASSNDQVFLSAEASQNSVLAIWKQGILSGAFKILLAMIFPPVVVFAMDIANISGLPQTWYFRLATFFTAPLVKFMYNMTLYIVFLVLFSYMVLVGFNPDYITGIEAFCIIWVFTFVVDKLHVFVLFPVASFKAKLRDWYGMLNYLEVINYVLCFISFFLHLVGAGRASKILYCLNTVGFFLVITKFYTASSTLGPQVVMIRRMMGELMRFMLILMLFLLAYGVSSQGLLYSERSPHWVILKDIVYQPYWQLYGELELDAIGSDECNAGDVDCRTAHWLVPVLLAFYLLIGNILLLTLLIAIFSHVFDQVEKNNREIWRYEMYFLVIEFQNKVVLAPPFSIIVHTFIAIKWLIKHTCWRREVQQQHFSQRHLEYLHLFEKEMMTDYLRREKMLKMVNIETTINSLQKRVDELARVIEDELIIDSSAAGVNDFIYRGDKQLMMSQMEASTKDGRPWPNVHDVIQISDKVQGTTIPADYTRPKMRRGSSRTRLMKESLLLPRTRNDSDIMYVPYTRQSTEKSLYSIEETQQEARPVEQVKQDNLSNQQGQPDNIADLVKQIKPANEPEITDVLVPPVTRDSITKDTELLLETDEKKVKKEKKKKHKKEKKKKKHKSKDRDEKESSNADIQDNLNDLSSGDKDSHKKFEVNKMAFERQGDTQPVTDTTFKAETEQSTMRKSRSLERSRHLEGWGSETRDVGVKGEGSGLSSEPVKKKWLLMSSVSQHHDDDDDIPDIDTIDEDELSDEYLTRSPRYHRRNLANYSSDSSVDSDMASSNYFRNRRSRKK